MAWRWITNGERRGFSIGDMDEFHELLTIPASKRVELSNKLHLQSAVWGILYAARNAYAVGNADYTNAVENLSTLLTELFKATEQVEATLLEILPNLNPIPNLSDMKLEDRIELAKVMILNAKSEIK